VDPDETADSAVVLRLVNDGYEVDLAQGAPEALEVLNSRQVDCLIAEMVLGEVDGINLCKTVKNHAVFASLPFVFVSSSSDPRCMAECLRSGADDFLSKPVDLEILSLKIHRLVSRKLGYDSRAGISGSLAQMSVTDLVQMLSSSGKSVKISFSGSGNVCEVYMDQGEIVHAVCGDSVGEPAFFQLMRLSEGDFQVYPAASFSERTIHLPVMGLLLEGARLADESIRDRQSIIENPPRGFDTR
jgi:CheY-like chemotaxis protein